MGELVGRRTGGKGSEGSGDGDVPNRARDHKTFMPMNAGNLSFRKFIIERNIVTIAPGFVTKSFKFGTFIFMPIFSATPAADDTYWLLSPCFSAAAASISGPIELVILEGSCSISFWRKVGRWA